MTKSWYNFKLKSIVSFLWMHLPQNCTFPFHSIALTAHRRKEKPILRFQDQELHFFFGLVCHLYSFLLLCWLSDVFLCYFFIYTNWYHYHWSWMNEMLSATNIINIFVFSCLCRAKRVIGWRLINVFGLRISQMLVRIFRMDANIRALL